MRYGREERQAIKSLSLSGKKQFDVLAEAEQGEIVAVAELCRALESGATLVAFSCLSGDGTTEELDPTIGAVFVGKKKKKVLETLATLESTGCLPILHVFIDDYEPSRMWLWQSDQETITFWCDLFLEEERRRGNVPSAWHVKLWSEVEQKFGGNYEAVLARVEQDPTYELLVHKNLEHIRRFPNKKRVGDGRKSTIRKVAQYALQGLLLEKDFPNAVLLQLETPWNVKDPLYDSMRQSRLPIVHLFPDERR